MKADFRSIPLAGGLITKSGLGFSICSGSEPEGVEVDGFELEYYASLPPTRFLLPSSCDRVAILKWVIIIIGSSEAFEEEPIILLS